MWASLSEELPNGFRNDIYRKLKDHGKNPKLLKRLGRLSEDASIQSIASASGTNGSLDGDTIENLHEDDFPVTPEDIQYDETEAAEFAKAIIANQALREQLAAAEGKGANKANPMSVVEEHESVLQRVRVARPPRLRPLKKVESNLSRKMCRHATYEEDKEKMMRPKINERRIKSKQYDKANKIQQQRLENVGYNVNSAIGIVTSGYGVEPPAGMDDKYYAEKKKRQATWNKKLVNPEWISRDPDVLCL